jgi:hypothetical protein
LIVTTNSGQGWLELSLAVAEGDPGMAAIQLEVLATGLVAPNGGTARPGNPDESMVVDQLGRISGINLERGDSRVFHHLSDRLVELGVFGPDHFLYLSFSDGGGENHR